MKIDPLTVAKAAVFLYIVVSPFIDYSKASFANQLTFKIAGLLLIVAASFYDLQLAILLTVAFLILHIHLNRDLFLGAYKRQEHFSAVPVTGDTIYEFPDACDAKIDDDRNRISMDLFNLYIDPKVKPYEEYIRKLSSPEKIDDAAESMMLL